MSQCFIKLAGLAGSVLHLSIRTRTKVPFCSVCTAGSRRALGTNQRESQMASCYTACFTSLKPSFHCSLHGLFSDCTLLVLAAAHNRKKEPYCCWFVSMRRLSAAQENIKKQLICRRAKKERSRRGPPVGWLLSPTWPENAKKKKKTCKRWLLVWLVLISAEGWVTGGREGATNKGSLQSA